MTIKFTNMLLIYKIENNGRNGILKKKKLPSFFFFLSKLNYPAS